MRLKKINLPLAGNYSSRKKWETDCWFKTSFSKELLNLILSPYERRNLIIRVAVLNRLLSGKSYKQISEELFVAPQTISSVRKALKMNNYMSYLDRSKKEGRRKYEKRCFIRPEKIFSHYRKTKYGKIYLP